LTGDNYVVKHNNLIEAKGRMTALEQKIILSVISEITPADKDFESYFISVEDFRQEIGTSTKHLYDEIKKAASSLRKKEIEIEKVNKQGKREFLITGYLSSAQYVEGQNKIEVSVDPKLKPYLLDLKGLFTQYQLKNILRLRSSHSIRLYELLKQYETIGRRRFMLDEFKQYLGLESDYNRFFDLEKRVLKPSMAEINRLTDLSIAYEKVKSGRCYSAIEYTIIPKIGKTTAVEVLHSSDQIEDIRRRSGLNEESFSEKQILELYRAAGKKTKATELDALEYIRINFEAMEDKGTARNKFAWLKKALENDYANATLQIRMGFDILGYTKGRGDE
jgi:plasmid replication initiation protein